MATTAGTGPDPARTPDGGAAAGAGGPPAGLQSLFAQLTAALTGEAAPGADGQAPTPPTGNSGAAPGGGLALVFGADNLPLVGAPAAPPSGTGPGFSGDTAPPAPAGPTSPLAEALARLFDAVEALAGPDAADADLETLVAEAQSALDEFNALIAGLGIAPASTDAAPAPAPPADRALSGLGAVQTAVLPPALPITAGPVDPSGEPTTDGPAGTAASADRAEPAAPNTGPAPGRLVRLAAHLNALAGRIDAVAPDLAEALRALPSRVAPSLNAGTSASGPGAAQKPVANPATAQAMGRPAIGPPAAPSPPAPAAQTARSDTAPPPSADTDAAPLHLLARPFGGPGVDPGLAPDRPALAGGMPTASPDVATLAVEIARRVEAGLKRFHIRLDPPELGRIEVRLDIDGDRLAARLAVDRPETLDLLQRDAKALERALTQAGLGGDRPSLEFTLKHNPFAGRQDGDDAAPPWSAHAAPATTPDRAPAAAGLVYRGLVSAGGIDLYV